LPVAYVVLRQGATVDAAALIAHVGQQLARFKVPREVVFVDDLPRNALGKVQHFR
jgi:fatty-acyl-CoA synthase